MSEENNKTKLTLENMKKMELTDDQIEFDMTNANLDIAKKEEEKQYQDMKLRIKFFYEKGETSILESLLSGNNLEDLLTKAEYIQSITDYDRKKLDELIETRKKIDEYEKKLENEKNELLLLKETEIEKKNSVEKLIEDKAKEIEDTNSKINTSQAELKKLLAAQKAQEDEMAATASALIIVGVLMIEPVKNIDFTGDLTEGIPAFLTIVIMVCTSSIPNGIMFGVFAYVLLKVFTGKWKSISISLWITAVLFALSQVLSL